MMHIKTKYSIILYDKNSLKIGIYLSNYPIFNSVKKFLTVLTVYIRDFNEKIDRGQKFTPINRIRTLLSRLYLQTVSEEMFSLRNVCRYDRAKLK